MKRISLFLAISLILLASSGYSQTPAAGVQTTTSTPAVEVQATAAQPVEQPVVAQATVTAQPVQTETVAQVQAQPAQTVQTETVAQVTAPVTTSQPEQATTVTDTVSKAIDSSFDDHQYYPADDESVRKTGTDGNSFTQYLDAPGMVNTSVSKVDAPIMDIAWCGPAKNVIFMLTSKNTLYRSENDGFTGHLLSNYLHRIGKAELGNEPGEIGEVSQIIQSPVDKSLILILGTHGINWVTEDCGKNFRAMNQGRHVDDFQFHPTERSWVLASAWTIADDFVGEPVRNFKELFLTKDLGLNWTQVGSYIYQFAWATLSSSHIRVPKERILIAHDPLAKGNQTEGGWKKHHQVSMIDDFETPIPVVFGGNKFLFTNNYLFVVTVKQESQQEVTLLVANPRDVAYRFREIELPTKRILDHGYTVLDATEHAVFLHIDHEGSKSSHGSLYVSDSTGVRYNQALKYNVRDPSGQCDFERVQGLEGIYLANVYDTNAVKQFQNVEADFWNDFPVQSAGGKKTSADAYQHPDHYVADQNINKQTNRADNTKKTLDDFRKTKISFDKGGMWNGLIPPERDARGKPIRCRSEEECSLHLHSVSTRNFGPFYSTSSSLGLILGTGNVGEYLSSRPDEVNTYLSRDGGSTWFEIAQGSNIYEVGDHGALIVMAPSQTATKDIHYSWNEGLTWEVVRVSEEPFEVTNIIIEPTNTGEKFLVYGKEKGGSRGVVAALDFSGFHQKICALPEAPDTPASDFETWTPNGRITPHCLLGRQVSYTRKKRESLCFNPEEYEHWKFVQSCTCTEEDWECDYGYSRQDNGACLPQSETIKNQTLAPPEVCADYYFVSQGYRKVVGDSCNGGVDHSPIRLPCPGSGILSSKNLSILLLLSSIVFAFVWLNNSQNTEKVKGCFEVFRSKIGAIFAKSPEKQGYKPHAANVDEEDKFTNIIFDENEEGEEERGDAIDIIESGENRKMTERNAMDAAKKQVPLLNKPADKRMDLIRGNY